MTGSLGRTTVDCRLLKFKMSKTEERVEKRKLNSEEVDIHRTIHETIKAC